MKEFMTMIQRDGTKLYAEVVYKNVYEWLKARGCAELVSES